MRLFELAIRTLCDTRPKRTADAVFLCSQTRDNQDSVLGAARRLLAEQRVKKILMVDSGPKSGYPGYAVWEKALLETGVPETAIESVDLRETDALNTWIEANAMIRHARQHHYTVMYVCASPFHQLRAFMTAITAALRHYPDIRIYSCNGHPLPWLDRVAHSQGETLEPRRELIGGELDRILKYQQKGDLAADTDVLRYLNQRDR